MERYRRRPHLKFTIMRTIKFRGKDLKSGEWFYGNLFDKDTKGNTHIRTLKKGSLVIDPNTVGQFTGMLDKNGKEIYEGDILEIKDEGVVFTKEVGFNNGMFGAGNYSLAFYGEDNIEIIGHIHDNKDLIKGE